MASVIAILRSEQLEVEPGEETSSVITVHNTGTIVEQFSLSVLGEAAQWATVEPSSLSLFPNTQQDAVVTFNPPRVWHVPPGVLPFGVKVEPANDPTQSVVEEGTLEIQSFLDVSAELIPQVATGKRHGKLGIAIDSRGNVAVPTAIRGRDPSDTLVLNVKPRQVVLQPGTASFAKLKIVPRRRYLRGPQKQSRFKVAVEPEGYEPILLDANMIQQALLPKGSFAGLAVIAALAVWFLLIRPQVKDAAVNAVQPQIASQQKQNASVSQNLAATNKKVNAVQANVAHVASAVSSTTSSTSTTTTSTSTTTSTTTTSTPSSSSTSTSTSTTTTSTTIAGAGGSTTTTTTAGTPSVSQLTPGPYSNAIEVVAAPGQNQQGTFVIPSGNELDVTDVIIGNLTQVNGSTVQVGIELPGQTTPHYFFEMSLAQLGDEDLPLTTPLVLKSGYTLVINVSCAGSGTSTSACAANVYYGGTVQLS